MKKVEIFIITKDAGTTIHKYSILGENDNARDQLVSGFLTAINNFAKEIGFPAGVSLIRSGTLEARFASGKYVFTVLMIDYSFPLTGNTANTETVLSALAHEINERFEELYEENLIRQLKTKKYDQAEFDKFHEEIIKIIDKYGAETFELYQKLILIEAMYAKVPQKWCIPLIEKVSNGENILDELEKIPKAYHKQLNRVIEKINYMNAPVWEIFAIPLYEPSKLTTKKTKK